MCRQASGGRRFCRSQARGALLAAVSRSWGAGLASQGGLAERNPPFLFARRITASPNPPYACSVGPAAQDVRDIENSFLDRMAHRGAAVRTEPVRRAMAGGFLLGRPRFGSADRSARCLRWLLQCAALDPVGDGTVIVAQPAGQFLE